MKPVHILLVEDNAGDILLTKEALSEANPDIHVSVVTDGEQATDFLDKAGGYADAEMPNLILLDINLPRKNGHEVLLHIKSDERLRHIPVIILTTSSFDKDVKDAYRNFASCFITKSVEVDEFMEIVAKIVNLWVGIAKLPVL
ncbi:response regulator [Parasediminibacterium sp. JCM 36343]|uniref:response regulator n=1 Tax=Parasediminibacterium sp. JCM 36343 TaxID=3374279 RepID=UPI00397E89CF